MGDLDRRAQLIVLLQTRDDHLPLPVRRDGSVHRGFAHRVPHRETCADCFGEMPGRVGCETCGSRGYLESMRDRDPYAIDKTQPYGIRPDRHEAARQLDRELDRIGRQLEQPKSELDALAEANRHPYGWELARAAKWRQFDYAALDVALELLRQADEAAYHLVHAVYVYGWQDASTTVEAVVERGLRFLDERMPDPIRSPVSVAASAADVKESLWRGRSELHADRREQRRLRVVKASVEWGWSTDQIATHEALSRRRVQQILDEHRGSLGEQAAVASGPAA